MKKLFIKLIAALLCIVALLLVSACGNAKYTGKKIESVKFVSVDYFGGVTYSKEFDFINNIVTIKEKFPYNEELNNSQVKALDPEKYEKLFDDLNACGFFKLKELYYESVVDGGENSIIVTFEDKTTFKTKTINSSNGIEEQIRQAFLSLADINVYY